jgi:hypothetical protein
MDATVAGSLAGWDNFFIAAAGAAGALAGLVFVALSINLAKILQLGDTTGRAAETMLLLGATLFGALLSLVPNQSAGWVGVVALIVWLPAWGIPTYIQVTLGRTHQYYQWNLLLIRVALHQIATIPFLIGGFLLLSGHATGIFWFAAGLLLTMAVALFNAWILFVEIMR